LLDEANFEAQPPESSNPTHTAPSIATVGGFVGEGSADNGSGHKERQLLVENGFPDFLLNSARRISLKTFFHRLRQFRVSPGLFGRTEVLKDKTAVARAAELNLRYLRELQWLIESAACPQGASDVKTNHGANALLTTAAVVLPIQILPTDTKMAQSHSMRSNLHHFFKPGHLAAIMHERDRLSPPQRVEEWVRAPREQVGVGV